MSLKDFKWKEFSCRCTGDPCICRPIFDFLQKYHKDESLSKEELQEMSDLAQKIHDNYKEKIEKDKRN